MSIIGPGGRALQSVPRGQGTLQAPVSLAPAAPDTYEAVPGVWADGDAHQFTITAAGVLTYTGTDARAFLFNGSSDLAVSIVDTTTYALYKNGVLVPDSETPHVFTSAAKTEGISITAIIPLNAGDTLQVFAKSLAGNQLNIKTLRVTFWGDV